MLALLVSHTTEPIFPALLKNGAARSIGSDSIVMVSGCLSLWLGETIGK